VTAIGESTGLVTVLYHIKGRPGNSQADPLTGCVPLDRNASVTDNQSQKKSKAATSHVNYSRIGGEEIKPVS